MELRMSTPPIQTAILTVGRALYTALQQMRCVCATQRTTPVGHVSRHSYVTQEARESNARRHQDTSRIGSKPCGSSSCATSAQAQRMRCVHIRSPQLLAHRLLQRPQMSRRRTLAQLRKARPQDHPAPSHGPHFHCLRHLDLRACYSGTAPYAHKRLWLAPAVVQTHWPGPNQGAAAALQYFSPRPMLIVHLQPRLER